MLLVPGEEGSRDWTHSLWRRGRSAVLQMARVPYLLAGRSMFRSWCLCVFDVFGVLWVCGCEVVLGCLSSALRASVGWCRRPLALSNFVDLPTKFIM